MKLKKKLSMYIGIVLLILSFYMEAVHAEDSIESEKRPKNVIVMVPDGCSPSVISLARWYHGKKLNLDSIRSGSVATYMADSIITDSASAATAFSTGHKTSDGFIGVGPRSDTLLSTYTPTAAPFVPLVSILEAAALSGMKTGLVATSRITHATPASFGAHVHDRGLENEIMEQLVHNDIDVIMGGGKRHLYPKGGLDLDKDGLPDDLDGDGVPEREGKRQDGENLIQTLLDRNYDFITNRDHLLSSKSDKLWGMFSESHMSPAIDNAFFEKGEPSLKEMASKAIEILSRSEEGFFLLIEGSQVDWGAHDNDPIYTITEFLAFDDAVGEVLKFAEYRRDTLVIVFPDHGTGGPTVGSSTAGPSYTATSVEDLLMPLKGMKTTAGVIEAMLTGGESLEKAVKTFWGIDLTEDDVSLIENLKDEVGLSSAVSNVVSRNHTVLGWTTYGHHGSDVPLWSYGPGRIIGHYDNTDIPKWITGQLRIRMEKAQDLLYVDLQSICPGYTLDKSDPENITVKVIEKNLVIPVSKDIVFVGKKHRQLEGVVVYAPEIDKVFVPNELKEMVD